MIWSRLWVYGISPCELCFWVLYDMSAMWPMLNVYIMPTMWLMLWVLSCLPCDLCCEHMINARYVIHIVGIESISYINHISTMKVIYIMVIMLHSVTSPIANYVYRKSLIEIYLVYSFVIIGIYFSYWHAFLFSLANLCVAVSINSHVHYQFIHIYMSGTCNLSLYL